MNDKLIDIKELCEWLNIKESHVRSMIYFNEIPYLKIGHLLRFHPSTIEERFGLRKSY